MGYNEDVKHAQDRVDIQLEKLYQLVGEKAEYEDVQAAYQEYLEKLTALYKLFFEKINQQKKNKEIEAKEWEKKKEALTKQYRQELLEMAVTTDQALGLE